MITSNVLDTGNWRCFICVQQSRAESLNVSCECIRPTGCMIQSQGMTDSAESRMEGTDLRGLETMGRREGKGEMLTCFSPSILLSACWTASRYLKCNSISRSTWRENEMEAGGEKVSQGCSVGERKQEDERNMRGEGQTTKRRQNKMRLRGKMYHYHSFYSHQSFIDSF